MCTSSGFSPRTSSKAQIDARAKELPDLLGNIEILNPTKPRRKNLGDIGFAIENHFGLEGDSIVKPDFWDAGIELKAVPMILGTRGYRSKEKTFITAINYQDIFDEAWGSDLHVRQKLNTLLVFVRWLPDPDWRTYPVLGYVFKDFMEDQSFARLAKTDWLRIQGRVRACEADLLSASDGRVLAPATKGSDRHDKRSQRCGPDAKRRSFALRQSMTKAVYRDRFGSGKTKVEHILAPREVPDIKKLVRKKLKSLIGLSVQQAAKEICYVASGSSRSYGADVVQMALGAKSPRSRIAEFEEAGITVRRPRISEARRPYENLSFPAFCAEGDLRDEETWDQSSLKPLLEAMLFVPLIGESRTTPLSDCRIGEPVFWTPDDDTLGEIGKEWTDLRSQLLGGDIDLSHLRRDHIHMRPHARNAEDTDSVAGHSFTRRSYWLNREFVATLL